MKIPASATRKAAARVRPIMAQIVGEVSRHETTQETNVGVVRPVASDNINLNGWPSITLAIAAQSNTPAAIALGQSVNGKTPRFNP
jgi:hypothetical protein